MASFFRRLRREKETPSEEPSEDEASPTPESTGTYGEEPEADVVPDGADPADAGERAEPPGNTPPVVAPALPAAAAPAAPPAGPPAGSSASYPAPPPLPAAIPGVPAPTAARSAPFSLCFVCGSPLDGQRCPTCQMTWAE